MPPDYGLCSLLPPFIIMCLCNWINYYCIMENWPKRKHLSFSCFTGHSLAELIFIINIINKLTVHYLKNQANNHNYYCYKYTYNDVTKESHKQGLIARKYICSNTCKKFFWFKLSSTLLLKLFTLVESC